jgi:trigger factor
MNIIKEQNDNLSAQLKISIEELDYKERVKKELNKLRVKVNMPGFRQGHVPVGLVQKMYGRSVLVEEINKILQESVGKFLEDEKIDLLGAPFPAQDSPEIDFENDTQFDFTLNVLLTPEVNLDFLKTFPAAYYKIKATDAVIDEQINALRQRFGTEEEVADAVKDHDFLFCSYQSQDNIDIKAPTTFIVEKALNAWTAAFIGHTVNDVVEVDIDKAFDGDIEKASKALNMAEEQKSQAKGVFTFTITKINRLKLAEINADFYTKAYPGREIKTEKDLRKIVAEDHSAMCAETVGVWFFNTHFEPIVKTVNLQYDDEMLRQFMEHQKQTQERQQEVETVEDYTVSDEEFEGTKKGTSWQLIQQKLMDTYGIKVEPDEVKQAAKEQISRYVGFDPKTADTQLGEYMESMVANIMKDEKQVRELYSRALDKKITQVLIENAQTTTKEVTWDEFLEIIDAKKEKSAAAPKKTGKAAAAKKETPADKKPATAKKSKKENTEPESLFE